jgi:para-nitrobenzyl esterase
LNLSSLLALLCLGLASLAAIAAESGPVVVTRAGAVRGSAGYPEAFRGIPYATPPVGRLRWHAPLPPKPWAGVRDATRFGNDCVQTPWIVLSGVPFSEDCLTANVWTLAHGVAERRPVLVFIYGGAFIGGSGAYALYDGASLAREGVVVVSFNYRVGIFGFFAHPGLSAESPTHASGNYGIQDQIAALQWVRDNIAAFGGDPKRVTIFGESAGAFSAAVLLVAPKAKGLFRGAILQSAGLPRLNTQAESEAAGARLGTDIAALRKLPAEELLKHNFDFFAHSSFDILQGGFPAPTIDGDVLVEQPRDLFTRGAINPAFVVVGYNADEGAMFLPHDHKPTKASYEEWVQAGFGPFAADVLRLNPAVDDASATAAMAAVMGDAVFNEPSRMIARSAVKAGLATYAYLFTKSLANAPPAPWHSEEMRYVFGTLDSPGFVPFRPAANAGDHILSRAMRRYWARFAAHGDPNGAGLPNWPAYDPSSDSYLEFGEPIRAGAGFRRPQLDVTERFWAASR